MIQYNWTMAVMIAPIKTLMFNHIRWCVLALVPIFLLPGYLHAADKVIITVEGVEKELLDNVLAYLSLNRDREHPNLTEGLIRKLHGQAGNEIGRALQAYGYYNPSIESELTRKDEAWQARYIIIPGERVKVTGINLNISGPGSEDEEFRSFPDRFPLKVGDPLEHSRYEEGKRMLIDLALDRGYLDGQVGVSRVEVNPDKNQADITINFETGPRYLFGDVRFKQDIFNTEYLQRFVSFKKGEPYSFARLFELQRTLRNTEYFDRINLNPRRDMAVGLEIPIDVELTPRKRWAFKIGVGYGTDTGPRVRLGVNNRRVNRKGHKIETELKASLIEQYFSARYIVPLKNPRTDYLAYTAGYFRDEPVSYDSEVTLVGVSHNRKYKSWQRTLFLDYHFEKFNVAGDRGSPRLMIPGMSWTYVKSEDPLYTEKGLRFFAELKGAPDVVISELNFVRLLLKTKFIYGLEGLGRFILRGDGGTTYVDNFSELPGSIRFFAGGDNSIRGFQYKSQGPLNERGQVTGGKHLLVGSIEYEYRFLEKWSAAIFYDAGNAFNDSLDSVAEGAGFGIRWISPIGQIRLDLAFAISEPDNPIRFHIIIGPDL